MGYRTVVVLFNDQASEWQKDQDLGKKIARAMNSANRGEGEIGYGRVVECEHADTQTLAIVDGYNFQGLTYSSWSRDEKNEDTQLKLLKAAAAKLGYKLTKSK